MSGKSVLLTGGTGFLGSHIGAELLRRGYRVVFLVRDNNRFTGEKRVAAVLDWHGVSENLRRLCRVMGGDILLPGLGLKPADERTLQRRDTTIIHCASNTSFVDKNRDDVEAVNVRGVENLVNAVHVPSCRGFHYVGTVFAAGRNGETCREEPMDPSKGFYNSYEETKCRAESLLRRKCSEKGIPILVYRPSIVYGNSRTGRTFRFNALYYPVRTVLFFKRLYMEDIRAGEGKKAAAMGVSIRPDGTVHLPIRIRTDENTGLNLIPVDFFVRAFLAIMDAGHGGGIYHIVNGVRKPVEEIIRYTCRCFGISGLRGCSEDDYRKTPENALERMFRYYTDVYGTYIRDRRVFDARRSLQILYPQGISCPDFDYEVFRRCMLYGVQVNWKGPETFQ